MQSKPRQSFFRRFVQFVLRPVSEQKALFVFLVLMCCVVIPVMCYATGAFPKPFVFAAPVFDCYLVVLLASLLRRLRLQWLVWVLCFFLLGGEVFCLLCYQSPYSMTVLQLILETNGREATEFLMGRGVLGQLAWSTLITVAAMLAPLLLPREGRKSRQSSRGVGSICLFFLLLFSAFCQGYSYFRLWQAYSAEVTTTIAENKYMPLRNSPFVRFLYGHALNVVSTKEL
ncbi:MAG: hypothetical protein IKO60_07590, partial [Bacteroidaceae bacterium]|nr:hypothetical protein [Bacteroidaceae bacterium]